MTFRTFLKVARFIRTAANRLDARYNRAADNINKALDDTLGKPGISAVPGVYTYKTALRKGTEEARNATYKAAYEQPINYASPNGKLLENIIKTRVPVNVINKANQLMQIEGNGSRQILAHIGDDGSVIYERLPDVRQIDYITRALNDVVRSNEGTGALGGINHIGRSYNDLSQKLRNLTKLMVPEYRQALNTAADPVRARQAYDVGTSLFSQSMKPDELAEITYNYTKPEKAALREGLRDHIDNILSNVKTVASDGNLPLREAAKALREFSSRANRQKVASVIGRKEANKLFSQMDIAAASFELKADLATNSKTFQRAAINQRLGRRLDLTDVNPLAFTGVSSGVGEIVRLARKAANAGKSKINTRASAELADFLTRPASETLPLVNNLLNSKPAQSFNLSPAARRAIIQAAARMAAMKTAQNN